jgi:hypothetical protein
MNKEQFEQLKPYCNTKIQEKRLQAVIDCNGNQQKACNSLGENRSSFKKSIAQIKESARKQGFQVGGETFRPISGHFVKGESALIGADGVAKLKWIKTDTNKELQLEILQKAITEAFSEYKGTSFEVAQPVDVEDDLLCLIPIGDAHIGMMAWNEECGEDFDLKYAEFYLTRAMERLVDSAPNAKTCIIADMGDFLHRQDNKNQTPNSGAILDCDNRTLKMMRIAVKILIHSVNQALAKFETVILRNVCGNHSPEGEQMLGLAMELYFHNNNRVIVDATPNKFWYYQHGKTLLGFHHGDKVKQAELPMIMASDVPKKWGDTMFRYFFIGHIHHQSLKEYQGCSVESINTLTPNDSWHHGSGYRSRKNIKLMVMHKKFGEIERITKDISMLREDL